jgi:outer membrane cobalamin receptor
LAQAPPPAPQSTPATPSSSDSQSASSTQPAPVQTTITVTGKVETQTPASLVVLDPKKISEQPGINLDDRLRQVPGFSLFRRSSSIVANPTTQGVSLRAIGSTGASRTLLLWDGAPLNDPFGGWVYWDRIDPNFVDRVEIVQGPNTSVFGYEALSGTISMFSKEPQRDHASFSYFGGNEGTNELSGSYSNLWGPFALSTNLRAFTTDGYYIVPDDLRGTADDKANVRFVSGVIFLDYLGAADRLNVRFDTLAEERHNGTNLTHNSTSIGTISANYTHSWQNDQIAFIGDHTQEQFHSTYSSVSADRNSETQTAKQTVPANDWNGALYWHHHASAWNTVFGTDVDDTNGTSYDYSYNTHKLTPSGGTLIQRGVFGQADYRWDRVTFYGGMREQFTGLGSTFFSPNGGIAVGLGQFRLRASGYRSQRTPTLNELYRQFRVGNVITLANANLVPEQLAGAEAGFDWIRESNRLSVTLFDNNLSQLILNRTLTTTPTLITRQRQNASSGYSRGVQVGYSYTWRNWTADANWLFADARLSSGPRLAQVPKQQGTGGITYSRNSTLVSFGVRAFGLQFDDDLNQFLLPGYATLQLAAQQRIARNLFAQASFENLLDRQYLVALTPFPNTGAPRLWRIGLRWDGKLR